MSDEQKPEEKPQEKPPTPEPQKVVIEVEHKPPPKDWKGTETEWAEVQRQRAKAKAQEDRAAQLEAQLESAKATKAAELAAAEARAKAAAERTTMLERQIAFTQAGIDDPHIQAFLVQQHERTTAGMENPPDIAGWLADETVQKSPVYSRFFVKPDPKPHPPPNPNGIEVAEVPTTGAWETSHFRAAARNFRTWQKLGADAVAAAEAKYRVTLVADKARFGLEKK